MVMTFLITLTHKKSMKKLNFVCNEISIKVDKSKNSKMTRKTKSETPEESENFEANSLHLAGCHIYN
jgi:ACT domain-containing protein